MNWREKEKTKRTAHQPIAYVLTNGHPIAQNENDGEGKEETGVPYPMAQAITITLPDNLYDKLKRAAELVDEPLETLVTQSLTQSLPPFVEEIPAEYQVDVYPVLQMNSTELQGEVQRVFPADRWAEYESLLERKKDGSLSGPEQARLDSLRREADVLMFRKGYAAALLKRRGYQIPDVVALSQVP